MCFVAPAIWADDFFFAGLEDKQPARRAGWNRIPRRIKDEVLELAAEGVLDLQAPVRELLPSFGSPEMAMVTLPVPEPSALAGLVAGVALLVVLARGRR